MYYHPWPSETNLFLLLFVVLLLLYFLFQILNVSTIFRLPSVPISLINTPMCMYFYCCSRCCPSIYMVLCCIHLIDTWISEVVVVVLHLILPCHSMVYLSSFALLQFLHFLSQILSLNSIFRLPSAITFCLIIPMYMNIYCCSWICPSPYSIMTWINIIYSRYSEVLVTVLLSFLLLHY